MLNSNEPIKVAYLQKSANQSMLNGTLVVEMVNNSFSESIVTRNGKTLSVSCDYGESKKNFGCLRKYGTFVSKKNEILVVKNISPLNLAKYLSYSEA